MFCSTSFTPTVNIMRACLCDVNMLCFIYPIDIAVGFSSVDYTATERDGSVSVCVRHEGARAERPFSVALLPREGKAGELVVSTLMISVHSDDDMTRALLVKNLHYRRFVQHVCPRCDTNTAVGENLSISTL